MKKQDIEQLELLQAEVEELRGLITKIRYFGIVSEYLPDAQPPDKRWICKAPRGLSLLADDKWGYSSFPQRFRTLTEAQDAGMAAEPWWEALERL